MPKNAEAFAALPSTTATPRASVKKLIRRFIGRLLIETKTGSGNTLGARSSGPVTNERTLGGCLSLATSDRRFNSRTTFSKRHESVSSTHFGQLY
jgi:hypothetical protein